MAWRKLGRIFSAIGQQPWMLTHASNPTAQPLPDGRVRILFSTRDAQNRSHIAAAVVELRPQPKLLELTSEALVGPGPAGAFDDSGTSMGCLVAAGGELWLYYVGWNLGVTVMARRHRPGHQSRWRPHVRQALRRAPVMDRHAVDPFSLSYPWVLREGERWRMWYGSNLRWGGTERDMDHVLKYAESKDGLQWQRDGQPILPLANPQEYAQARPCVVRDSGRYRLWFAHRGDRYRLGYAESADGRIWQRNDSAGALAAGAAGEWDAEMVTYPCVFDSAGARYLLYNGNAYGRTGFGLAVWE